MINRCEFLIWKRITTFSVWVLYEIMMYLGKNHNSLEIWYVWSMHFKSSQELFQKGLFLSQATVRQGVLVLLFKTLFLNILNNWLHTFRANLFLKNVGDVQLQLCTTLGISTNMDMSVRQRENWGMPQYPSNLWNKQTNKPVPV